MLPGEPERVFFSDSGLGRGRDRHEDGGAVLAEPGRARAQRNSSRSGGYHGDTTGAMAVCDPEAGMHALFRGLLPEHYVVDLPRDDRHSAALSMRMLERHAEELAGIIVEPLVQGAGGMLFHDARRAAPAARGG